MIQKILNRNYYRNKIVITFSMITVILVAVLSKVSYDFMYDFYLDQLTENVETNIKLAIGQIEPHHENALKESLLTESTKKYFERLFRGGNYENIFSEVFIFNKDFEVLVHSDPVKLTNIAEPRLLLNEKEIFGSSSGQISVSLPFKGNDDMWYLWGFYRFSDDYWLALRLSASNFEAIDNLSKIIWTFGLVGVLLSILLGYLIAKSITRPVNELVNFSAGIGKGNLKLPVPLEMKGELKILSDAMILMRENIADNQKEKEKILAQIAHEIRNPLGGIELLNSLIYESVDNNSKNKEYSGKILKEIIGLKELITSYLNYSRPTPAIPEKIYIPELVDETLSYLQMDIRRLNISVKKNLHLENIIFDKIHFRNILLNLLKNSIESINENGEIIIYSCRDKNKQIISIADNGRGIQENILNKIFDPFFTTKNNGTGLGLAACKKFCEENSAELIAENIENGSVFKIIQED